jgi:hypothetical protein
MKTYTITLKRKFWFNRKLKKVKGNLFPSDLNGLEKKFMLVVFEDERKLIINLDKFEGYEISKELFYIQAEQVQNESHNQAKIA